jgi:type IV secretory pathway TrbL component
LQGGQLGLSGIGTALQGLQGGMQGSGLGMQGAGVGLQGLNAQLAGTAQGMQGAGLGIQGAQAGLQGVDRQLAGTAQGMQGAQVGLQGVSGAQAGYGLADRAAGTLGTLGGQQLAAQTGILGLQNQIGGQQQSQEQQYINQGIQNFAQAQENPMQRYNQLNALVRGYAVPGSTTSQYQASPNLLSQATGAGIAGLGLYNAMSPAKT